jgi:hypothetical protein
VWLSGKQRHKSGMTGEIFRAGQDPQRVVVPIIIIIIIITATDILHPYETSKNIILYNLIFRFLDESYNPLKASTKFTKSQIVF